MTRKDTKFIVQCIIATCLVVLTIHFVWPEKQGPVDRSYSQPIPSSEQTSEYMYVGSQNSTIYHKPSCRWAQKIASYNLVTFKDAADAKSYGYRACKVCRP